MQRDVRRASARQERPSASSQTPVSRRPHASSPLPFLSPKGPKGYKKQRRPTEKTSSKNHAGPRSAHQGRRLSLGRRRVPNWSCPSRAAGDPMACASLPSTAPGSVLLRSDDLPHNVTHSLPRQPVLSQEFAPPDAGNRGTALLSLLQKDPPGPRTWAPQASTNVRRSDSSRRLRRECGLSSSLASHRAPCFTLSLRTRGTDRKSVV